MPAQDMPYNRFLTLDRRDWIIGLIIVLIAFALRLIVVIDRANTSSAVSSFDPLPGGSDQATYYSHVLAFETGDYPPPRFFYQPGISYYMIAIANIMRTHNLGAMRVFNVALAALNCGLLMATTQLVFGRRRVSILAGLLLAIYPVSAFYDTDFVITSQATMLLSLAMFGVMWVWRGQRWGVGAVLYGLSFGAIAVTRFEPILLAPVFGLWLIAVQRSRKAVAAVVLAALASLVIILPVVLHNRAGGANYLITPVGAAEMYRGNSRDATGVYSQTRASRTTSHDYYAYLLDDIRLEPKRFAEVTLRKIGLFFSAHEPGNNLNYFVSGEPVSPLLRAIPLNFPILAALALFGLSLIARKDSGHRPVAVFFVASLLAFMGGIMLIWVEARLRTPVVLFMIPPAAFGIVSGAETLAAVMRRQPGSLTLQARLRRLITPWPVILVLLFAAQWSADHLPRPLTARALPDGATGAGYVYDGTLKLVGWQVQERYSREGLLRPFTPYVVTLYWELVAPTDVDYSFALGFFVDGERLTGWDDRIGMVTYPTHTTSEWDTGTIYVEHVPIDYRHFDGPTLVSGDLLLSVYPERDATHLLAAVGAPENAAHVRLAQPALVWDSGQLDERLQQTRVAFGDELILRGWDYPATVVSGEPLTVELGWQTTSHPIHDSYIISLHAQNDRGVYVAQRDSPPRDGRLLTSSLPTRYAFTDTTQIALPDSPGSYTLSLIVYDVDTKDRLTVAAPDNILQLGTVEVVPGSGDASP